MRFSAITLAAIIPFLIQYGSVTAVDMEETLRHPRLCTSALSGKDSHRMAMVHCGLDRQHPKARQRVMIYLSINSADLAYEAAHLI